MKPEANNGFLLDLTFRRAASSLRGFLVVSLSLSLSPVGGCVCIFLPLSPCANRRSSSLSLWAQGSAVLPSGRMNKYGDVCSFFLFCFYFLSPPVSLPRHPSRFLGRSIISDEIFSARRGIPEVMV